MTRYSSAAWWRLLTPIFSRRELGALPDAGVLRADARLAEERPEFLYMLVPVGFNVAMDGLLSVHFSPPGSARSIFSTSSRRT